MKSGCSLEVIANDYMIAADGSRHLLEVNPVPNVPPFPAIWEAYRDYVVDWVRTAALTL